MESGDTMINNYTINLFQIFPAYIFFYNIFFKILKTIIINIKLHNNRTFLKSRFQEHCNTQRISSNPQDRLRLATALASHVSGPRFQYCWNHHSGPFFFCFWKFFFTNFTPISNQIYFNFKFRIAVVWFGVLWADLRGRSRIGCSFAQSSLQSVGSCGGWVTWPQTKLGVRYTLARCASWGVSPYRLLRNEFSQRTQT